MTPDFSSALRAEDNVQNILDRAGKIQRSHVHNSSINTPHVKKPKLVCRTADMCVAKCSKVLFVCASCH